MAGFLLTGREVAAMRQRATLGAAGTSILAPTVDTRAVDRTHARKEASNKRATRWPNTLTALRRRKEEARQERLERAEAARRVQDEIEEARVLEQRTHTLEAARSQLVASTDKMKLLRTQQMAVHAGLVRQKQLAQKKRRADAEKARAKAYHDDLMRRVAEAEEEDRREHEAKQAKAREMQAMLHAQLEEAQEAARKRMAVTKAEGRSVRHAAERAAAEEAAAEEGRRLAQRSNNELMQRANEELRALKLVAAEKEAEEARQLERYRAEKEAQAARRAQFVAGKRAAAESRAAEMRAIIEGRFQAAMSNEQERLEDQQAQAQQKKEDAAAAAEAKRAALWAEIEASRASQAERKRGARQAAKHEDLATAAKWSTVLHGLSKEEYEAQMAMRERTRLVAMENRRHAQHRADHLLAAETKEKELDTAARIVGEEGDTEFNDAATTLLAQERARGRKTDFIEKAIARSRKDPMIAAGADM